MEALELITPSFCGSAGMSVYSEKTIPNAEDLSDLIKYRIAFWLKPAFSEFNFSVQKLVFNLRQVRKCLGVCVGLVC